MTFKDVALKNFQMQIRKYLSYFLCSSFSIMIFFMYSTLMYNDAIREKSDGDMLALIFNTAIVAVSAFSVFFINYVHSAFIKSRYKEFGVYMTLGMTSKDISSMVLIENILIFAASFIAGLVSGLIFSRLFQMVVLELLKITGIGYSLSYKSFAVTIAFFTAIFAQVVTVTRFTTRKLEISELLKKARKNEGRFQLSAWMGFAGTLLLGVSVVLLYVITRDEKLKSNAFMLLTYIAFSFSAVYLSISHFGRTVLVLLRRSSKAYYRNILLATEINHKFNRNRNVIFLLTILSAMIVFFVASPFSLHSQTMSIAETAQPNHVEFAEVLGVNTIALAELENIVRKSGTQPVSRKTVEFISLYFEGKPDKLDALHSKPVISQTAYNRAMHEKLAIPRGKAVNIITDWRPGDHGVPASSKLRFENGKGILEFKVIKSGHAPWVSGTATYPTSSGVVLNDEDYVLLKQKTRPENVGKYHIFEFKDWRKTEDFVNELKTALRNFNKHSRTDYAALIGVGSRIEMYNGLKRSYSLFVFVTVVMGLLFFIAAGSVLYFKQYTEIAGARQKFFKLYKIGISEKEVTGVISKELMLTFFTPLVLGSMLGYSFMYLMTYIVNGEGVIKEFMLNATIVVAAYFVFQMVFYLITRRRYVGEILEVLEGM